MKKFFLLLSMLVTISMASCCENTNNQDAVESEAPVVDSIITDDEPMVDTIINLDEQIDAEIEQALKGDSI